MISRKSLQADQVFCAVTEPVIIRPAILHVPYTYYPDACGGTEVYVRFLARALHERGWPSLVVAPGAYSASYVHEGTAVRRFVMDPRRALAQAYGEPDEIAAQNFRCIVEETAPKVVHLHAHTAAVSERLADVAHAAGAKVVFTYHTPTASCARGTMVLLGKRPCDGTIERKRCTACALEASGVPRPLARLASSLPSVVASRLTELPIEYAPLSRLRTPGLIARRGERFIRLVAKADRVVAVCRWVRDVLERNGVPTEKIALSRQGIADNLNCATSKSAYRPEGGSLRIAYFGRIDATKGLDLLTSALRSRPHAEARLDVYAVAQSGADAEVRALRRLAEQEPRLRLRDPVPPEHVIGVMKDYDLIAIPSRWLETGPMVALEAFAAGVPVLGAKLGGIAELVRDGVDGILLPPDDAGAWAVGVEQLARQPETARRLRHNVRYPRTMNDVAHDMAELYSNLLRGSSQVTSGARRRAE